MRSCTLCFVPPLNIIICPISGCIARVAGGWSVLIPLHQPTTVSAAHTTYCVQYFTSESPACICIVLLSVCAFQSSAIYIVILIIAVVVYYLHQTNSYDTTTSQTDHLERTTTNFKKQHKRHELPQHFHVRLPVRTDGYPVIKKYTTPPSKRSSRYEIESISRIRHQHGLRLL